MTFNWWLNLTEKGEIFTLFFILFTFRSRSASLNNKSIFSVIRIPAHRLVMMAISDYFCALLGRNFKEGEQDEVTITGVDGPTLQLIIDFCYSGHIEINEDNFHQIIDAALPMGLVRIEQKCERFGVDILETSNCLDLFLVAERYSLDELRGKSWDLICNSFEALPVSELCEMSLSFITDLLKSDRIHAREDLIFHRLVDWIAADEKVRSQYASDLLKLIHMDKLTFSVCSLSFD